MQTFLINVLQNAMRALRRHSKVVRSTFPMEDGEVINVGNIDESTFRSFVVLELKRCDPQARCQTEWHRFDLLFQTGNAAALIEFKFYFPSGTIELDGAFRGWKGGPGPKNEEEFRACVNKLRYEQIQVIYPEIAHRYVVLVYETDAGRRASKYSFTNSYDCLDKFEIDTAHVQTIDHVCQGATCKLVQFPNSGRKRG